MNSADFWAALATFVAAFAIGLRRYMLKPGLGTWAAAPRSVQHGLAALAIALAMRFITVCCGYHANDGEAAVYVVLAVVSVLMTRNLHRERSAHRARHEQIEGLMRGRVAWFGEKPPP